MADFKVLNDRDHARAVERGQQVYAAPRVVSAHLDRARMCIVLRLDSGADFILDPKRERNLAGATPDELDEIVIEGVGGTISFPSLDVDLTVANLLDFPDVAR